MQNSKKHRPSESTVVIIGGGVIGLSCAHYLHEAGFKVTVIDQNKMGSGSSYANCGYICPSHVLPLAEPGMVKTGLKSLLQPGAAFKIKPQLRFSLYKWLYRFSMRCNTKQMLESGNHLQAILNDSKKAYSDLFDKHPINAQWKTNGLFYVLKTSKGIDEFARSDNILEQNFGLKADYIDGCDLSNFDPSLKENLAGGFLYKNDASLEPAELIKNWVEYLENKGVEFIENCQLMEINKRGQKICSIKTNKQTIQAGHYVFATGAWSQQLSKELDCKIPVEPCKGYSVTIDKPEICPKTPMLFPEHRVGITPFDNSFRLGSMMEFSGHDKSIPDERIKQLYKSAEPYLNSNYDRNNAIPWYGWRPMTWDSLPIIGQVPKIKNAMLATGHNMLGLTLAPATGKLIAELIVGKETTIDPKPYSPMRFQ
jgi:D-amino-acid dehydrogenase